jgi:release factor glutamine methyltransferase
VTPEGAQRRATERLKTAGIDEAALDAESLLRHVLGWDRATLIARSRDPLPAEVEALFLALVEQRASRRPLQYLTGTQAFWHHEFRVTPDVLIPRPETELIVEASLALLQGVERPVIVDVGTGSGCIALSLAAERPDAEVHAIDVSAAALEVARDNARRLGVEGRVRLHHGHLLEPVAALAGGIDLVASNPPYIGLAELPGLAPEVRDHEPVVALSPAGDRYSVYRELAPEVQRLLKPGGHLALELGQGMEAEVGRILEAGGLEVVRVLSDLQSIPRTVLARRFPPERHSP